MCVWKEEMVRGKDFNNGKLGRSEEECSSQLSVCFVCVCGDGWRLGVVGIGILHWFVFFSLQH